MTGSSHEHGEDAAWPFSREANREFGRLIRRLQRVQFADPVSVVSAQRRAGGRFWGALAMGRRDHRVRQAELHPELLPPLVYDGLMHVPRMDAILSSMADVWSLAPDGEIAGQEDWPSHVQWGADRLAQIALHLRGGRSIAAAVMTRSQLERWTVNVAHHHDVDPAEGEATADWITRVWSVYPSIRLDLGAAWIELSEFLHGRAPIAAGQVWELVSGDLKMHSIAVPTETLNLHRRIAEVAITVFGQVRGCVRVLAQQAGHPSWADLMMNELQVEAAAPAAPDFPNVLNLALVPVDPALAYSGWAEDSLSVARSYRLMMAQAARRDQVHAIESAAVIGAVLERRVRTIERFRFAWEHEQRSLGVDFEPGTLAARLFRYIAIAETAELLSLWATSDAEATSLRLAGGSLRSAYHLWLEDTDLSLPCMRALLEHTCAARTWRTKPQRAARITGRTGLAASPARWIEAAGWKRAHVLGRALGEFSHVSLRARWTGARRLLEDIQRSPEPASKRHTARGHALDVAAYLLAFEAAERLAIVDADLAAGFRREVTLLEESEHRAETEELLKRVGDLRSFDFGEPDTAPRSVQDS